MPMSPSSKKPGALTAKGGSGYNAPIPSPRQSYDVDARSQAIMSRPEMMAPEMVDPEFGTMRPGMSQEEIDMYNKPQMDINDAFFGPETRGMTLIDMIIKAIQDAGRIPSPETR